MSLNEKKQKLQDLREQALAEVKDIEGSVGAEKRDEWIARNEELDALAKEVRELEVFESKKAQLENDIEEGKAVETTAPVFNEVPVEEKAKTLGQALYESKAFQAYVADGAKGIKSDINWSPLTETKTLLTESGYPPAVVRDDLIVPTATRNNATVIDLFDVINTDQYQYKYLEETTFTNNGAEVAEGSAMGESALAFTERTEEIRKFGVSIPVTEELLADVSAVQGYLDSRLRTMLELRLSDVLIGGSGSAPIIRGILNKSGINTFDFSSYSGSLKRIGQIYQAITEIRKDAFLEPDAILMHPSDWFDVVTETNAVTTSGALQPLFVGAGMFNGAPVASMWGVPVVPTTAISAGTALVGAFGGGQAVHIVSRQGIEVSMSDSHDDFFTKDKVMMKATMRLGFPIYRASAFCSITNF
jgi:HK97 family phage major capsid protein